MQIYYSLDEQMVSFMSLERLKKEMVDMGEFGRDPPRRVECRADLDPEKGVTRPCGTDANKKALDYVVARMEEAGLNVKVDKVGNIYGRLDGKIDKGAIWAGSHVDSVVNGGQFDGTLGVMTALEATRRLIEEGHETYRPIEVVVYTGEEGSAFPLALLGSSTLIGKVTYEQALAAKNRNGEVLEDVLDRMGYKGNFERKLDDVDYSLELHIEQGPVLDAESIPVGIVENITGLAWILATIEGEENHAGTTPMKMRKDALLAASEIVSLVNKNALDLLNEYGGSTVGTVGRFDVFPGAPNIVPGRVEVGIDVRDVVEKNLNFMIDEAKKALKSLEKKYGVSVSMEMPFGVHKAAPLSPEVVDTIEKSAKEVNVTARRMNSGAGHDSQNIAEKIKTGMIFVPSIKGISHAPMEWTEWEDIEEGTKVLTQTLKNLSMKK
jgi:N-carbamoyl-L-amino-acid hydrolase